MRLFFSGRAAKQFCEIYNFPKMKSLFHRRYGVDACNRICRAWMHMGDAYCSTWVANGCLRDFVFSDEDIAAVAPTLEFVNWLLTVAMGSPAWEQGNAVHRWRPRRPVSPV